MLGGWSLRDAAASHCAKRIGVPAGLCAAIAVSVFLVCVCAPAAASAGTDGPFAITSFSLQSTRTREVAYGPGIPGYGFIQEPYAFTQAAGHPDALTGEVQFAAEKVGAGDTLVPTHDPRDIVIDLPSGLTADPRAAQPCSQALLGNGRCPADTQVGVYVFWDSGGGGRLGPIVELAPERGQAAELGLETEYELSIPIGAQLVRAAARGYGMALVAGGLPRLGVTGVQVTLWGVPGEASHDPQRGRFCGTAEASGPWECTGGGLSYGAAPEPFLTMGADCGAGPQSASVLADSWQEPGRWVRAQSALPGLSECEKLWFYPEIEVTPETRLADEPVGLTVGVKSTSQEGAGALATPPLRDETVTLPAGMSIDPAVAGGLRACPASGPEGIGIPTGVSAAGGESLPDEAAEGEELASNGLARLAPGHCPEASTVGRAEASTPLLASPLEGRVYLAQPGCGGAGQAGCTDADAAAGSLYRLYVELGGRAEPDAGVIVKLEAQVRASPATGQLTVALTEAPQLPLSGLRLELKGGPRALLENPAACGPAATTSLLRAWSAQGLTPAPESLLVAGTPDAAPSSSFDVLGPDEEDRCPHPEPFAPGFIAGTLTPRAGRSSALTFSVTRSDREQRLRQIQLRAPPGLSAILSGVPLCEAELASTGECPEASRIGTTIIAAGAGSNPLELRGGVYLTDGYDGAPFGLSIVIDAAAGPLNLGLLVIRARIDIDPQTAALTITSDPLPQIVLGVQLRLQRVTFEIERPNFLVNPTNCDSTKVEGTLTGEEGGSATVSSPFAVGDCASLAFAPKLAASTQGNGRLEGHGASLRLRVSMSSGEAGLRKVKLELPKRLPARLTTLQHACVEETFEQNPAACPGAAVIGHADVDTPILPSPLNGPAYLVSVGGGSGRAAARRGIGALPDVVLVLQADGVRIDLTGSLYVSANDVTSAIFASIPDVPIRSLQLTLPEGRRSILSAGAGLCMRRARLKIESVLGGQNGASARRSFRVAVSGCRAVLRR
jgi:hypothetical protein